MPTSPSERAVGGVADVAVIGAGPAGLSAAVAAATAGARVALLDAEPVVGGQFWRHPLSSADGSAAGRRAASDGRAGPRSRAADAVGAADGDGPGRPARRSAGPARRAAGPSGALRDAEVAALHHDLRQYRRLRRRLDGYAAAGALTHLARHEVWAVEQLPGGDGQPVTVGAVHRPASATLGPPDRPRFAVRAVTGNPGQRREVTLHARAVVLATGAYDLQLPFPGWDLPGVMTAGGVQSLLKGHVVLAGRRVVVAGTGPFLLSVAAGLARSGATVPGVFEAAPPAGWLLRPRALLAARTKVIEGAGYAVDLARHRIGYHTRWTVLRADGGDRLRTVTVAPLGRSGEPVTARARTIAADVLAVGWGFVPQLELPLALGCGTIAGGDGIPVLLVDAEQRSTVPGVYAAGEICGVGGAALAAAEGQVAGAAAAEDLIGAGGGTGTALGTRSRAADSARRRRERRRNRLRSFAAALQRVYPVPDGRLHGLADDTIVCRCEEVTAGAIREVARRDGAGDARTAKLLARPGMGWCQGRICGYAAECVAADAAGTLPQHRPAERPVAAPISLGAVAGGAGSTTVPPTLGTSNV